MRYDHSEDFARRLLGLTIISVYVGIVAVLVWFR